MGDVANVMSAQVDLLWSVAMALLIAEIFLIAKFLAGDLGSLGGFSKLLLGASALALLVSMFAGYLTYGAAIEMLHLDVHASETQQSYRDAGISAFVQFSGFALGMISFLWAFLINSKEFGKAIRDAKG